MKYSLLPAILFTGLVTPWLPAAEKTLEVVRFPERRNVELPMVHSRRVPSASMKAKCRFQEGQMRIDVSYTRMKPAVLFGGEITSFVLWAVSRDGKAENLGELWVRPEKHDDTLRFSTGQRTFALIVTAEPYYQIDKPSDSILFWNAASRDPQAASSPISFTDLGEPAQIGIDRLDFVKYDGKAPLDVLQAEKTYETADRLNAGDYASSVMGDALTTLQQARQMARSSVSRKGAQDYARRSVASSNEAIRITLRRLEAEQLDAEIRERRTQIEELENRAREAEASAREVQEEADRQVAALELQKSTAEQQVSLARIQLTLIQSEKARVEAERDNLNLATLQLKSQREALTRSVVDLESEGARLRAESARLSIEGDRLKAERDQLKVDGDALREESARLEAESDKLRADKERLSREKAEVELARQQTEERLQSALSQVADTRDSARGIILNLPDILFDVNKATLKTELKTAVAKLAGILLMMSEPRVRIEGHTDSTGSEEYNLKLSTERSQGVLAFLQAEGIDESRMTAVGYGLTRPIAGNDTREGRRKNRRVEIIISDREIGEE